MIKMSGIDERPSIIPICKCGQSSAWLVLDGMSEHHHQVMCVNLVVGAVHKFGKWNTHHYTKEYVKLRATGMRCNNCGKIASLDDFMVLMRLFQRECLGDV